MFTKKIQLSLFILFSLLLTSTTINAQDINKLRCYTMEHFAESGREPLRELTSEDVAAWYRKTGFKNRVQQRSTLYTIPIIFHIVHNGEAVGSGSNLAKTYIDAQLIQLNNDFRRVIGTSGNNSHPDGADTEIEFCPAALDPSNVALVEEGINRVNRNTAGFSAPPYSSGYIDGTIKPSTFWNPDEYFNVWILDLNGFLGYAQFPETDLPGMSTSPQSASTDGCVVDYPSVGSTDVPNPAGGIYDAGRTLTHEAGHWLGLRHIWGDGGCGVDDFCNDTPESDASNFNCPTGHQSCGTADMVENYMDYTQDDCMNIYTNDQKDRMQYVMGDTGSGSVRRELLATSTKCTSSPSISFSSANSMTDEGTSSCLTAGTQTHTVDMIIGAAPSATATVFLNMAGTAVNGVDYTISPTTLSFPAGQTAAQTITISIAEDAYIEMDETLDLTFTVNPNGGDAFAGSSNQTHSLMIHNDDLDPTAGGTGTAVFFTENFSSVSWTQTGSGTNAFVYGTNPGLGGRSPYVSRNGNAYSYTNSSSDRRLISPAINASIYSNISVNFDYIADGELSNGTYYDYGRIEYSTNGTSFTAVGPHLQNINSSANLTVNLPAAANNASTLYIAFRWINDNSVRDNPPLSFDNVTVSGDFAVSTDPQSGTNSSNGYAEHDLGGNETVHFYDQVTGDIMMTIENLSSHNYGCTRVEVNRSGTGSQQSNASEVEDVTDKTYLVTPEFNNPTGNYRVKLYYTAAEINGWVSSNTNGNPATDLQIVKSPGPIASATSAELTATTDAPFNTTDHVFTGDYNTGFSGFALGDPRSGLVVNTKVFLNGPYETSTSMMHDSLRDKDYIPMLEPFTDLGYTHYGMGGSEVISNPSVLMVTGANAIVDWVMLELRNPSDSTIIIATRSALVQRDGNVVDVDGSSFVNFGDLSIGSYYLSIKHRNHLGIMTSIPYNFDEMGSNFLDFSDPIFTTYGTNPLRNISGVMVMWAGDGEGNGSVVYTGSGTDVNPISIAVFTNPLNVNFSPSFPLYGYERADYTMDGKVVYTGSGTDVNEVSISVFTNPSNSNFSPSYPLEEQLPQ